jgi:amidophosphoribosyltransferase
MGGLFGVVSKKDCVEDLFYGTDYHSHLGTKRGGLAVRNHQGYTRSIHNIENDYFRSKFEPDLPKLYGNKGIGIISDYDAQPLIIGSHLGTFSIVTVGRINNITDLARKASRKRKHFSEMSGGATNPTELVAMLIAGEDSFQDGIEKAQKAIKGSCSLLVLTQNGIYAARDRLGRTPIVIGKKDGAYAASSETCAFPNLGFHIEKYLGAGEIVFMTADGYEQVKKPGTKMQICAFLWVYYGFPASDYEGINVESVRYRCGAALANKDNIKIDIVAGIPDSGTGHAIGYANEKNISYKRPFIKYTPTWPRSFMPHRQNMRNLVAKMKLIPIKALIENKKILFCDDSIVRGTQLQDNVQILYEDGAKEVHMRVACPPLIYPCKFLRFSASRSTSELAARRAIKEIEGRNDKSLDEYAGADSPKNRAMVEKIRQKLGFSSLRYQKLEDLVLAIGLPKERLCTHCWDGSSYYQK